MTDTWDNAENIGQLKLSEQQFLSPTRRSDYW